MQFAFTLTELVIIDVYILNISKMPRKTNDETYSCLNCWNYLSYIYHFKCSLGSKQYEETFPEDWYSPKYYNCNLQYYRVHRQNRSEIHTKNLQIDLKEGMAIPCFPYFLNERFRTDFSHKIHTDAGHIFSVSDVDRN